MVVHAKSVDVNDIRELTQHIDVVVHMHEELTAGLATQHDKEIQIHFRYENIEVAIESMQVTVL